MEPPTEEPPAGRRSVAPSASDDSLLFVDNYKDTGIGTFGAGLFEALHEIDPESRLEYTETPIVRGLAQCVRIYRHPGPVVVNVGLTSWGRSKLLNLIAFVTIGLRSLVGRATLILLHNAVEVTEEGDTGYRVGYVVRLGANLAVRSNSRTRFLVFSQAICEVLREKYGIEDVRFEPLPCPPVCEDSHRTQAKGAERPVVVSFGYLSPYKGIENLVEAYPQFRDVADLLVIGRPHPVLLHDPEYARYIQQLRSRMRELGVTYLPYVVGSQLCPVLTACAVGVLPYRSTTGTSASFTTMASAGLPVLATDLREFRDLAEAGAGIRIAPGDPTSIASSLTLLLRAPNELTALGRSQSTYAASHQRAGTALRVLGRVGRSTSGRVHSVPTPVSER
jgi:glycosyltransferase involved in cell wall biosynthesis